MDKQLAPKKVTVRWIEDEDTASDLDVLASRLRLNRTDLLRLLTRLALYPDAMTEIHDRIREVNDHQ